MVNRVILGWTFVPPNFERATCTSLPFVGHVITRTTPLGAELGKGKFTQDDDNLNREKEIIKSFTESKYVKMPNKNKR